MSEVQSSENHIPIDEWPDVAKMLEGFGDPSLPASSVLSGETLLVDFQDGTSRSFTFVSPNELTLRGGLSPDLEASRHPYRAVQVREGILYVDVLAGTGPHAHNISLVYSQNDGVITLADSHMHNELGTIRTKTDFFHGRVRGMGAVVTRERTDELVGLRIYYRYSPDEHYEHIYLSPGTFIWHCVRGGERGLADADQTMAFKLAEDLVIFYWKETVMPVESFLVVDLKNQRSIGRMFCWDAPSMDLVHLPFDSEFTLLNRTTYPPQ